MTSRFNVLESNIVFNILSLHGNVLHSKNDPIPLITPLR